MLINGRQAGPGKLIDTRTWGGLVGLTGNPGLIDGGYASVPTFASYKKNGTRGIEGYGVDPDIEKGAPLSACAQARSHGASLQGYF